MTFTLVVASLVICAAVHSQAYRADYFLLTRQWYPGMCASGHCRPIPDDGIFTMHGLWPNYNNGSWPSYCDSSAEFDGADVAGLLKELSVEWPSYYGSDKGFWAHEWLKHGTCSKPFVKDEEDYFSRVLELKQEFDLLVILRNAGIYPDATIRYSSDEIESAIVKVTGGKPIIKCSYDEPAHLTAIWMCFTTNFVPMDCHRSTYASCSELIFLPTEL